MKKLLVILTFTVLMVGSLGAQTWHAAPPPSNGPGDFFGSFIQGLQQGISNVLDSLGMLWNNLTNIGNLANMPFPAGNNPQVATQNVNQPAGTGTGPGQGPGTATTNSNQTNVSFPTDPSSKMPVVDKSKMTNPGGSSSTNGNGMPNNLLSPKSETKQKKPVTPMPQPVTPPIIYIPTILPPVFEPPPPPEEPPEAPEVTTVCDISGDVAFYVVDHADNEVLQLHSCSQGMAFVRTGSRPLQLELSPDGKFLYVTCFDGEVDVIDTNSFTVVKTYFTDPTVNPSGIAVSPDGSTVYITSFNPQNPSVQVLKTTGQPATPGAAATAAKRLSSAPQINVVASIPVTGFPQSIFLTPDGQTAYVVHPFQNTLTIIDTLTNTVIGALSVPNPVAVAFSPNGTRMFVSTNTNPGTVQVIDTSTYATLKTITVGSGPEDILVMPDGRYIVVTNRFDGSLTLIDGISYVAQTLPIGINVRGLTFIQ